jgi:hypothetical protein
LELAVVAPGRARNFISVDGEREFFDANLLVYVFDVWLP